MKTELEQLRKKAKKLYIAATTGMDDMDCGRALAETIRPQIGVARKDFSKTWAKIKELDPFAPNDPFA